jgi:hypothetical protein
LKDSSTAQNIMACGAAITLGGRGVADVVTSLADLSKSAGRQQTGTMAPRDLAARITEIKLLMDRSGLRLEPLVLPAYAEIHVYEPQVVDGHMEWRPIIEQSFSRTILGVVAKTAVPLPQANPPDKGSGTDKKPGSQLPGSESPAKTPGKGSDAGKPPSPGVPLKKGTEETGLFGQPTAAETAITTAIANQFGTSLTPGRPQAGTFGTTTPVSGGNQVTVNVNRPRLLQCFPWICCRPRPQVRQQTIVGADGSVEIAGSTSATPGGAVDVAGPAEEALQGVGSGDR